MDSFLVDYLTSGKAWVFIGSGPSIQRGYPTWKNLASGALDLVKIEGRASKLTEIEAAYKRNDYPTVFEEASKILGGKRVIQHLDNLLKPSKLEKNIYDLMAQWPVSVYLTTNFDDEIQKSLANVNQTYIPYSNSPDHMSYLLPSLEGAIFKLHGDLRSENGLILTSSQYRDIKESPAWSYWRTRLTSVFQMNRIVVIGYSLSDPHIQHILRAANDGAGVLQPIIWLAPDVKPSDAKDYLEKQRIRVVSYDNRSGDYANLYRLLEHVSEFIPKRTSISIQRQMAELMQSPTNSDAAAPGFFVFNKLAKHDDFEEKRAQVVAAALQAVIPKLKSQGIFTLKEALEIAGWPENVSISQDFALLVINSAIGQSVLSRVGERFEVHPDAIRVSQEQRQNFEHQRERFKKTLELRIKHKYPSIEASKAMQISQDIEASTVMYFKRGGLSLATTLMCNGHAVTNSVIPSSIIKFIQEASSKYDDLLSRQAFCTVSVDAFAHAEPAERMYLGRIAQGFFGFHALGAFGDAAKERLGEAKQTVWVIDSSAQIPALALASPMYSAFRDCFLRFKEMGIRLFTTEKLLSETREHLWFANKLISDYGTNSYNLIAAATGQAPYRKSNVFLEGFIRWQSAGNPKDWDLYLTKIFGKPNFDIQSVSMALAQIGIEVVAFEDWQGYTEEDKNLAEEYFDKIVSRINDVRQQTPVTRDFDQMSDPGEKASPEAEALAIVKREREGQFYMLSERGVHSPSWFISDTSMLNLVEQGPRITWQTESFLKFSSTIFPPTSEDAAEQAFEILLLELAQSGVNLVDERMIEDEFGGIIEQATINLREQRQMYEMTIGEKYGESPDVVMARIAAVNRPLAAVQLSFEIAQKASDRQKQIENVLVVERKRADAAEEELQKVEKYRNKIRKLAEKKSRNKRKKKS